jgi:hypothetical protein
MYPSQCGLSFLSVKKARFDLLLQEALLVLREKKQGIQQIQKSKFLCCFTGKKFAFVYLSNIKCNELTSLLRSIACFSGLPLYSSAS